MKRYDKMKYLKYFEDKSSFKDSDIYNDIKDVFQDIIDDYDMEETFRWDTESIHGYSYRIQESGITRFGQGSNARIIIWFDMALPPEERRELVKRTLLNSKRLNSIGYDTRLDTTNKNGIELSDFKSSRSYDAFDADWLDEWIELQVSHANISESRNKISKMRHLKYFNESMSDHVYHIQAIKDVFQDLVDEYGLDNVSLTNRPLSEGMYYSIQKMNNPKRLKTILFTIQMIYDNPLDPNVKEFSKKLKEINDNLEPYISRLKRMGYGVEDVKKYSNLTDIQIGFSDLISESKDSKYEVDMIKDIFSDVVDEFGLYEYDPNVVEKGLLYYIREADSSDPLIIWIADFTTNDLTIPHEILNSEELKGFEKRLKNMGYNVKDERGDKNQQYYHIRVSK